jgi:hypothetical protein
MVVQDGVLWISDHSGDPYLHLVDLRDKRLIASRGRQGEGPGDFGEPPQFSLRPGDSTGVWAYDARLRRLTRESASINNGYRTLKGPGEQLESVWSYAWISGDRLVGTGDVDTNRLRFTDSAGRTLATVKSSLLGPDSVSLEARRSLSAAYFTCIDVSRGRIAIAYVTAGRIDIHDSLGAMVAHANVPFPSNGEFELGKRGRWTARTDWRYYADCTATGNHLYGLFAGHRTDGPGKGHTVAARYVHVFDWDGRLIRTFELDHEMSTIAVDGDTVLFAAGQETQGVYSYRLAGQFGAPVATIPTIRR